MSSIARVACAGVLLGLAAGARAQDAKQVWISGRVFGDVDSTIFASSTETGVGAGAAFGIDARRFGFQATFDWPLPHTEAFINTFEDPLSGTERITVRPKRSSPAWGLLFAVHPWSAPRISVSLLAGWAMVNHRYEAYSVVTERLVGGTVQSRTETPVPAQNFWWPGVEFGVDAGVRVSAHVVFAPELRVMTFPGADRPGAIVRPAAGLRWLF